MSVNTPATWSAHALRARLGMPSGPAALRGLTRLNVFLTSAAVNERPHVLVAGRDSAYCPQSGQKSYLVCLGARHPGP